MPKMTVVTLPTKVVDVQQQITKKSNKISRAQMIVNGLYSNLLSLLSGENALLGMLAFLLGRVFIMGEFAPVGLAFFAAVAQVDVKRGAPVAVWAIIGVLSGAYYYDAAIYIFSICLYFCFANRLARRYKQIIIAPLIMFCGVLVAGLVVSICKDATLYQTLLVLFEAGTCMILSYIFMHGVPFLTNRHTLLLRQNLTSERLTCMIILLATAVAGLGDIMLLEYSVRNMIGGVLVMMMALIGGAGLGAVMGVALGLLVGLSDGNASLAVSLYALAGALAGTFRGLGKLTVIIGFILGSAITVLYFGQDNELNRTLKECIIAGGLFFLVPSRLLAIWQNIAGGDQAEIDKSSSKLNKAVVKINEVASIFNELALEFGSITKTVKGKINDDELAKTLSAVGEQVCFDCENRVRCWESDFYRTYNGILDLVGRADIKSVGINDMPVVFEENCIKRRELLDMVKSVAERNRTLVFWQKKIIENRQMIMEQMKAASGIISNLTYEIGKDEDVDLDLALSLKQKAASLGCELEAVQVHGVLGERVVEVWKKTCNGNRECMNTILPLVAGLVKEKMTLRTECGNEFAKRKCKLIMEVAKRFSVETGMASVPKAGQEVCGDTCGVIELNQGKVAIVLSDGMGSGCVAEAQSKVAINFLRKLLIAGFDTDVAVKTINSMLLLRTPDELFVTIDIAIIDTYSGEVEFLKIGSAPSFIKRVREVTTIKSTTLPVGILTQIEIEPIKAIVVIGDFIVMASDGIIDVPQNKFDKGNWLANFLRQSLNSSPQVLANQILAQAQKMSNNQVTDDMTVVVAKMVE